MTTEKSDFLFKITTACFNNPETVAAISAALLTAIIGGIAYVITRMLDKRSEKYNTIDALIEEVVGDANVYFSTPNDGTMINIITKVNKIGCLIKKETQKKLAVSQVWTEFRSFIANDAGIDATTLAASTRPNIELARTKANTLKEALGIKV